jgi:hypothetical protein
VYQKLRLLLPWVLLLAAPPVSAQFDDTELELVPLPREPYLSGMAMVVTHIARPADCLAAIAVNTIDGEKRAVSAKSFLIEPGVHTINGKAILDTTNCPITDTRLQLRSAPDLEVNFELGNTYYIGYYHKPDNTDEWQLVVWNIETNPPDLQTTSLRPQR